MLIKWEYFTLTRRPTWSQPWGTHRHQQRQAKCRPVINSYYAVLTIFHQEVMLIVIIKNNQKPSANRDLTMLPPAVAQAWSRPLHLIAQVNFLDWRVLVKKHPKKLWGEICMPGGYCSACGGRILSQIYLKIDIKRSCTCPPFAGLVCHVLCQMLLLSRKFASVQLTMAPPTAADEAPAALLTQAHWPSRP